MNGIVRNTIATVVGFGLIGSSAMADEEFEIVPVSVQEVFVPDGFDDNDETVVVLDGYLPSGCYKLAETDVKIDEQTLAVKVTQFARRYAGACIQVLVPFTNEVRLGVLPMGDYKISANNGLIAESLKVKEAQTSGPDDFLYAPVESVTVHEITTTDSGQRIAFLSGRFTTNCMAWEKTLVNDGGKTLVIQPIIKMLDLPVCEDATIPFRVAVDLPMNIKDGRHLLHTRSLNGRSVNEIFTVEN